MSALKSFESPVQVFIGNVGKVALLMIKCVKKGKSSKIFIFGSSFPYTIRNEKFLNKILDFFKSCVIKKNDCEKMCPTCDSPKPTERPTTKPRPQTCEEIFAIDIKKCNTSCESKFQYCWKSCKTLPCRVQCYSQNKKCLESCPCRNLRYN